MKNKLSEIESQILTACEHAHRQRDSVKLLLATKTVSAERLQDTFKLGPHLFGENTAQELTHKVQALASLPIEWHFIGHLQTNKVKDIIKHCQLIHSVDRISLAKEISKRAQQINKVQDILVEVNTSQEEAKSGADPEKVIDLCREIAMLPNIKIKGLMTVALHSEDKSLVRQCFRQLKHLSLKIQEEQIEQVSMQELSMGMSQDFIEAIEEGATLIRIGSLLFGERK